MLTIDLQLQGLRIKKKISKLFCSSKESCHRKQISTSLLILMTLIVIIHTIRSYSNLVSIQARELTTMQSMLQNQIEQFGNHTFKEGSVVIPGQLSYRNDLNYVKLENIFQGILQA